MLRSDIKREKEMQAAKPANPETKKEYIWVL